MEVDIPIAAVGGEEWRAQAIPEKLEKASGGAHRRANRLMRMAYLGASDCLSGQATPPESNTGIVLASSHGNIAETLGMLQGIREKDQPPMPLDFINVSTNMAGFHVMRTLGLQGGPSLMISRGPRSFSAALEIAGLEPERSWLVGIVEECAWPLDAHRRRLRIAADEPLAEASYWLWLRPNARHPIGRLIYQGTLPDGPAVEAAVRRLAKATDLAPWVSYGASEHGDGALDLPSYLGVWEPRGAGFHCARDGRQICGFLQRRQAGLLLHLDRDPISGWWTLTGLRVDHATSP